MNLPDLLTTVIANTPKTAHPLTPSTRTIMTAQGVLEQLAASYKANNDVAAETAYVESTRQNGPNTECCIQTAYFDYLGNGIQRHEYYILTDKDLPEPKIENYTNVKPLDPADNKTTLAQDMFSRHHAKWREQNDAMRAERDFYHGRMAETEHQ